MSEKMKSESYSDIAVLTISQNIKEIGISNPAATVVVELEEENQEKPPEVIQGDFFKRFVKEGTQSDVFENIEKEELVPSTLTWIDEKLLEEGQKFMRENWVGFCLMLIIQIILYTPIRFSKLFAQCSRLHSQENSPLIVLKFVKVINGWFHEPFLLSPASPGFQSLKETRRRHWQMLRVTNPELPIPRIHLTETGVKIFDCIRQDLNHIQPDSEINPILNDQRNPFTHFDIGSSLVSFYGVPFLYPGTVGLDPKDEKGLRGFIHLLGYIGAMFGLKDEFNPTLQLKDETSQSQILNRICLQSLKECNEITLSSWILPFMRLTRFIPGFRIKSILYYILHDIFKLRCGALQESLNILDKISYYLFKKTISLMSRYWIVRIIINGFSYYTCMTIIHFALWISGDQDKESKYLHQKEKFTKINGNKYS